VIKETISEELPKNFQTDSFALEHGIIDRVVKREDLRVELETVLRFFQEEGR
jgi:acetyl-CoA carboxylase carboxyl transferase subunit beta